MEGARRKDLNSPYLSLTIKTSSAGLLITIVLAELRKNSDLPFRVIYCNKICEVAAAEETAATTLTAVGLLSFVCQLVEHQGGWSRDMGDGHWLWHDVSLLPCLQAMLSSSLLAMFSDAKVVIYMTGTLDLQ